MNWMLGKAKREAADAPRFGMMASCTGVPMTSLTPFTGKLQMKAPGKLQYLGRTKF